MRTLLMVLIGLPLTSVSQSTPTDLLAQRIQYYMTLSAQSLDSAQAVPYTEIAHFSKGVLASHIDEFRRHLHDTDAALSFRDTFQLIVTYQRAYSLFDYLLWDGRQQFLACILAPKKMTFQWYTADSLPADWRQVIQWARQNITLDSAAQFRDREHGRYAYHAKWHKDFPLPIVMTHPFYLP
jgi:hypothetical protein